jgi:uncharacterized membrane protein
MAITCEVIVGKTKGTDTRPGYRHEEEASMNAKKVLLWFVLIDFSLLTAWVIWQVGYFGIWQAGLGSPGAIQVLVDLGISVTLVAVWMIGDARSRGVSAWPWVVATLFVGSLAPLAYLIRRETAVQS